MSLRRAFLRSPHHAAMAVGTLGIGFATGEPLYFLAGAGVGEVGGGDDLAGKLQAFDRHFLIVRIAPVIGVDQRGGSGVGGGEGRKQHDRQRDQRAGEYPAAAPFG